MYTVKLHVFTISLVGTKYINHEIEFAATCVYYVIDNIYRRPSSSLDKLAHFTDEFTTVTRNLQEKHIKSCLVAITIYIF